MCGKIIMMVSKNMRVESVLLPRRKSGFRIVQKSKCEEEEEVQSASGTVSGFHQGKAVFRGTLHQSLNQLTTSAEALCHLLDNSTSSTNGCKDKTLALSGCISWSSIKFEFACPVPEWTGHVPKDLVPKVSRFRLRFNLFFSNWVELAEYGCVLLNFTKIDTSIALQESFECSIHNHHFLATKFY